MWRRMKRKLPSEAECWNITAHKHGYSCKRHSVTDPQSILCAAKIAGLNLTLCRSYELHSCRKHLNSRWRDWRCIKTSIYADSKWFGFVYFLGAARFLTGFFFCGAEAWRVKTWNILQSGKCQSGRWSRNKQVCVQLWGGHTEGGAAEFLLRSWRERSSCCVNVKQIKCELECPKFILNPDI